MRQIAERAGVNRSTVSLALRNDARLKLATRQKIQALAREMGYRQNPTVAQLMTQLRAGQQRHFQCNLGYLDFGLDGGIECHNWSGVEQRAKVLGYGLEHFAVDNILPQRIEQILVNRGIRGVIIRMPWGTSRLPDEFRHLWNRFACCVVGTRPSNPELHFAADDNYLTSMTAVQHLLQLGFSRIGLAMHATINCETNFRFVGGYMMAHLENPRLVQLPVFYVQPNSRDEFLAWYRRTKPEVIICIQEEILEWLREAGHRVPEEVNLVHLDLEAAMAGCWAGMRQCRSQVGIAAVDIVVSQINHNEVGTPCFQKATLTESTWELGSTLGMTQQRGSTQAVRASA